MKLTHYAGTIVFDVIIRGIYIFAFLCDSTVDLKGGEKSIRGWGEGRVYTRSGSQNL